MFSAFLGGFLGASIAMHPGFVVAFFNVIFGLMALLFGVLMLWLVVGCTVYYVGIYVGIPLWRFVILPAMVCFIAVIGAPFYVLFILAPWCLRRLFRTTPAAGDPLWHPLR